MLTLVEVQLVNLLLTYRENIFELVLSASIFEEEISLTIKQHRWGVTISTPVFEGFFPADQREDSGFPRKKWGASCLKSGRMHRLSNHYKYLVYHSLVFCSPLLCLSHFWLLVLELGVDLKHTLLLSCVKLRVQYCFLCLSDLCLSHWVNVYNPIHPL